MSDLALARPIDGRPVREGRRGSYRNDMEQEEDVIQYELARNRVRTIRLNRPHEPEPVWTGK